MACTSQSSQPESAVLTADETYFVDAYVRVRRAESYYPYQPTVAESLFAGLEASIDTVRIAKIITTLNLTPDRWAMVYAEIEKRLREAARPKDPDEASEGAGSGTGAAGEVEKNDEHH